MTTMVSRPHYNNLVRWAKDRPEVVVLSADLTASCEADGFRDAYPDRFFSFGLGEQNMMSFAGGLAREGFFPFVHTFAVFICRRPFDQVAMSLAYPNLPARLLGFLPGLTTPGGATHQAIDDLALMRVLPNMTVLECGDATEVESVLDAAQAVPGPVYIRMLRGEVPRIFDVGDALRVGRARLLSEGEELTLISSGICTEEALRARGALEQLGLTLTHVHVSSIKPLDVETIGRATAATSAGVITIENHSVIGGLGSAVAEVMAEAGAARPLIRLGLQDTFAHGASRSYLLREYGLDAQAVIGAAEKLLGRSLEADLRALDACPPHGAQAPQEMEERVEDL